MIEKLLINGSVEIVYWIIHSLVRHIYHVPGNKEIFNVIKVIFIIIKVEKKGQ